MWLTCLAYLGSGQPITHTHTVMSPSFTVEESGQRRRGSSVGLQCTSGSSGAFIINRERLPCASLGKAGILLEPGTDRCHGVILILAMPGQAGDGVPGILSSLLG